MTIFDGHIAGHHVIGTVEGGIIYDDNPKSRRLRILNRIRRIFGRDEQAEIIAVLRAPGDDLKIVWSADGTCHIE